MKILASPQDLFVTIAGTTTSIGGAVSSFLLYAIPALQVISLIVSIVAGVVTIVYALRHNKDK